MSVAALAIVCVVALWVLTGGVIAARVSTRQNELLRRRRFVSRVEPEVMDKGPEQWIAEAEEDFQAHQQYLAGLTATQRQRDLNRIRTLGA